MTSYMSISADDEGAVTFMANGQKEQLLKLLGIQMMHLFKRGEFPNSSFEEYLQALTTVATKAYLVELEEENK